MILAINTSTLQFALAILKEDGTILAEYLMTERGGHFGNLMPALQFLLDASRCNIHDINGIAVATGPGSFTGLRVGLSVAKGLCHALEAPIIGISSLEALASQIPYADIQIGPIIDSRKGEVFTAQFTWGKNRNLIRETEDICLSLKDLSSLFKQPTIFIGNDFPTQSNFIKKIRNPSALLAPACQWNLRASAVGALGLNRLDAHDFDNLQDLNPLYHRPPDIRPKAVREACTKGNQIGIDKKDLRI